MIRSMTGFARVEAQSAAGRLVWELRSVNHRYLDVQLRLPEEFRGLENDLRQLTASRIGRGKVEAGLRYTREGAAAAPLEIDQPRLELVLQAAETIGRHTHSTAPYDVLRLLAWPGVLREEAPDFSPLLPEALKLYERALEAFSASRASEGERLSGYLVERCEALAKLVARVRARIPEVREQWLARVRARCQEIGVEVEPARLEQEVALAAQRLDVDEEMSRLLGHVQEVRQALARDEAVGRRLDFLMQELNREANTLSSKSQDTEMTRCAVDMKVAIEQMREQVQNIE